MYSLKEDPKYKTFFEILEKEENQNILYQIKNNIVYITLKHDTFLDQKFLDFNDEYIEEIEIPDIYITNNNNSLILYYINCSKLIFNTIKSEKQGIYSNLKISKSKIKEIEFKDLSTSESRQFQYDNIFNSEDEDEDSFMTLPKNFPFDIININNKKCNILSNKNITKLTISNTYLKKFNSYPNLEYLEINSIKNNIEIDYSQLKLLEVFVAMSNYDKINLDIVNLPNLEVLDLYDTYSQNLIIENCPKILNLSLYKGIIEEHNHYYIDLNKLNKNDNELYRLSIIGYKTKNIDFIYKYNIVKLCLNSYFHENIVRENITLKHMVKKDILFLSDNKKLEYYSIYTSGRISNCDLYSMLDNPTKSETKKILKIRQSNSLMVKLLKNPSKINKSDLKKINEKDKFGLKAIAYCNTLEGLKILLNNDNYVLDLDDRNLLQKESLIAYFDKRCIENKMLLNKNDLSLKTKKNIMNNNFL